MTYEVSTDQGKVRLLISDVGGSDGRTFLYTDEEIQAFLDLKSGNILLAAAAGLRAIAGNEVQVAKRIRFLELSTDGPAVAKALNDLADRYEVDAEHGEDGDFDIAEMMISPQAAKRGSAGWLGI